MIRDSSNSNTFTNPHYALGFAIVASTATLFAALAFQPAITTTDKLPETTTTHNQGLIEDQSSLLRGFHNPMSVNPVTTESILSTYLDRIAYKGLISDQLKIEALDTWNNLRSRLNVLPTPTACPGPNGDLLFSWDTAEHHLELEFIPGEAPSFFYLNRMTNEAIEEVLNEHYEISSFVLEKGSLFA